MPGSAIAAVSLKDLAITIKLPGGIFLQNRIAMRSDHVTESRRIRMTNVDECRDALRTVLSGHNDVVSRARRAYFDRPSYALSDKHDVEFEIKSQIANRFEIPFRSVVFSGSAQLGFSPQQDTLFRPGGSDLDIACIDANLYQKVWQIVIARTRGFKDKSVFLNQDHADRMADHLLKNRRRLSPPVRGRNGSCYGAVGRVAADGLLEA